MSDHIYSINGVDFPYPAPASVIRSAGAENIATATVHHNGASLTQPFYSLEEPADEMVVTVIGADGTPIGVVTIYAEDQGMNVSIHAYDPSAVLGDGEVAEFTVADGSVRG